MKTIIFYISFITCVLFPVHSLFAQKASEIDSLSKQITFYTGVKKLKVLLTISDYHLNSSLDLSIKYASDLLIEIDKIRNNVGLFTPITKIVTGKFLLTDYQLSDFESKANDIIGQAYFYSDNVEKSVIYFQKNLELSLKRNDLLKTAGAFNNLGIVYRYMGYNDSALNCYTENLKIYRKQKNLRGISKTYNNLGVLYEEGYGNLELALQYYQRTYEIELKRNDTLELATSYLNLGGINYKLGNYKKAIAYCNRSIVFASIKDDNVTLRYTYKVMSDIFKKQNDFNKALIWYEKYIGIKDSIFRQENMAEINELNIKYETEKKEREILTLNKQSEINKLLLATKEQAIYKQRIVIVISSISIFLFVAFVIYLVYQNKIRKRINEKLRAQNAEILQQKEEILAQRDEIEAQHSEIFEQNTNITNSINYARKTQNAVLPLEIDIDKILPDYVLFYKPRDIVSGDFFVVKKINDIVIFAVADCTGHGVPGAFMSMLGIALLNEIVFNKQITATSEVLEWLRSQIKIALRQSSDFSSTKDGMDIAICAYNKQANKLQYSGANSDMYVVRNKQVLVYKAERNPIGWYHVEIPFSQHEIDVSSSDIVYLFSDGFTSQFDSKNVEKFKAFRFKQMLVDASELPFSEQSNFFEKSFINWSGANRQIDDITIFGVQFD